ncbi:hypothetical protein SARC_02037, partial [Sphaeroforma arctica JP610]
AQKTINIDGHVITKHRSNPADPGDLDFSAEELSTVLHALYKHIEGRYNFPLQTKVKKVKATDDTANTRAAESITCDVRKRTYVDISKYTCTAPEARDALCAAAVNASRTCWCCLLPRNKVARQPRKLMECSGGIPKRSKRRRLTDASAVNDLSADDIAAVLSALNAVVDSAHYFAVHRTSPYTSARTPTKTPIKTPKKAPTVSGGAVSYTDALAAMLQTVQKEVEPTVAETTTQHTEDTTKYSDTRPSHKQGRGMQAHMGKSAPLVSYWIRIFTQSKGAVDMDNAWANMAVRQEQIPQPTKALEYSPSQASDRQQKLKDASVSGSLVVSNAAEWRSATNHSRDISEAVQHVETTFIAKAPLSRHPLIDVARSFRT